jgi:hypothetical protein
MKISLTKLHPTGPGGFVIGDYKYLDFDANGIITFSGYHPISWQSLSSITFLFFSSGLTYKISIYLNFMFMGVCGKKYASLGGSYRQEIYLALARTESQENYWRPDNRIMPLLGPFTTLVQILQTFFRTINMALWDNKWYVYQ